MKNYILFFGILLTLISCKSAADTNANKEKQESEEKLDADFTIAFGSCNRSDLPNVLWDDINRTKPSVWIWGGDIIYADTDEIPKIRSMYTAQKHIAGYKKLAEEIPVIGTWDDHDYGINDGGSEFKAKKESQQEFLNFMDVPKNSPRRTQEGIYAAHHYRTPKGTISIFVLDTRYFRTAITPDTETEKRLKPNYYGEGTILGEAQWAWLTAQLNTSISDFNIIVSSIQLLSNEHGFETWGNFPHEVDQLKKTIADSNAQGVVVLSGDRHISEFSKVEVDGLEYPLIDFTSSGLTHAYRGFKGEPNPFRVGEVVSIESFGTLEFSFNDKNVTFRMVGDKGEVLGIMEQRY